MNKFTYQYPVKQYFGKGCLEDSLKSELQSMGKTVMLAYGSGSLKRTGLYDRIRNILEEGGKTVVDFSGIMPNPTLFIILSHSIVYLLFQPEIGLQCQLLQKNLGAILFLQSE